MVNQKSKQVLGFLWLGSMRGPDIWCLIPPWTRSSQTSLAGGGDPQETTGRRNEECSNPWGTNPVEQVDLSSCSMSELHTLCRAFSTSTVSAVLTWLLRGQIQELCCLIPSVPVPDPAIWLQGSRTNQPELAVFLPIMFDNAETV